MCLGEGDGSGSGNHQDQGDSGGSQEQQPMASGTQQSADKPSSTASGTKEGQIQPIKRPYGGGMHSIRLIRLLVNHFHVDFGNESTIYHYDVDVKHPYGGGIVNRKVDNHFIMYHMPFHDAEFLGDWRKKMAYDGLRNMFSAVCLLTETYMMTTSYEGDEVRKGPYMLTINLVGEVKVSKLNAYLRGENSYIPRDILQGMDLVMKEDPKATSMVVGRSFYSRNWNDLPDGFAAYQGFQQRLRPRLLGYSLCLDYSALCFPKPLPVFEFLQENVQRTQGVNVERFRGPNDVKNFRGEVEIALKGMKVKVNHRTTNRKYTIAGLSQEDANYSFFNVYDPESKRLLKTTYLPDHFKNKWKKDIKYVDIPCLELGTDEKPIQVPMEFCELVEGPEAADKLKTLTLVKPSYRKQRISEMVEAEDGPHVDTDMTNVAGHVVSAPELKVRACFVKADADKCPQILAGKSLVDGKSVDRWAFINFAEQASDPDRVLQETVFRKNLRDRCSELGIQMAEPLVSCLSKMSLLSSTSRLEEFLISVVQESSQKNKEKLQLIVCVMAVKGTSYKNLKWVCDTKIGVVTQCCLSSFANKGKAPYFSNLCLKINAKLGGNNIELKKPLLNSDEPVMFIGADVYHPPHTKNTPSTSIAAVVGSVNWPAVYHYAARVSYQRNHSERIEKFGAMCLDLVQTYARLNKVMPKRIVVFRDGVSEGQIEKVVGEELSALKESMKKDDYEAAITVIVAQTRRQKRLSLEKEKEDGKVGVVESGTMHPNDYDMYLCSHYAGVGSNKATHFYVVSDDNNFTPQGLQKLIYKMCFTSVNCTKPLPQVPPLYYAHLAARRGRIFQEAAKEAKERGDTERNKKRRKSPSCEDLCKVHTELKDTMYFV